MPAENEKSKAKDIAQGASQVESAIAYRISDEGAAALIAGVHSDPFAALGVHAFGKGFIARAFVPGAEKLVAFTLQGEEVGNLPRRNDDGFFEGLIAVKTRQPLKYLASNASGRW